MKWFAEAPHLEAAELRLERAYVWFASLYLISCSALSVCVGTHEVLHGIGFASSEQLRERERSG